MFGKIANIFRVPELRKKILFTLGAIVIFRLGSYAPIPGTSWQHLQEVMRLSGSLEGGGGYLGFISAITGGSMQPFLFCLGIMPYISASIVLQLLTTVIPALERLSKEGEAGRKKINEYTRYLTVALCLVQGVMIVTANLTGGVTGTGWRDPTVNAGLYALTAVTAITAGTIFLMWLGEQIDEFGIGNGVSLIIMAGIVDRLPAVVKYLWDNASWSLAEESGISAGVVLLIMVMFVLIVLAVVLVTQGQRRIPIQQAKMVRGRRVYGSSQRQYLPLRVNQAGVIPVIFASSLLIIPGWIAKYLSNTFGGVPFFVEMESAFRYGEVPHMLFYVALIVVFCYFWTAIQFQPSEMANNLRDYGSFIPGMRPGRRTAEYLEKVMNRITYVGAAFLAAIAITPVLVSKATDVSMIMTGFLGGTGLLIIVSVALDVVQRVESHLIMRHYEGFLSSGRVKGRRG